MKTKQYTIRLHRTDYLKNRILGILSVPSFFMPTQTYRFPTLEPLEKPKYGCVPKGIYRLTKRYSPKFKKQMYYLAYVPGRSAIMIHSGNTPKDTRGCILVGTFINENFNLRNSSIALEHIMSTLDSYYDKGYNINLVIQ